jgi:pyruvate,water dikinase
MSTKTLAGKYFSNIATLHFGAAGEAVGEGVHMGDLVAAGLPVPPGFVSMRSGWPPASEARCDRCRGTGW